jgi:hypothetical protein
MDVVILEPERSPIAVERLRNVGSGTVAAALESWLWAATHLEASKVRKLTRETALPQFEHRLSDLISSTSHDTSTKRTLRITAMSFV